MPKKPQPIAEAGMGMLLNAASDKWQTELARLNSADQLLPMILEAIRGQRWEVLKRLDPIIARTWEPSTAFEPAEKGDA